MNIPVLIRRCFLVAAISLAFILGACTSNPEKPPSVAYEEATAESEGIRCPVGQVLTCEASRTGRIRFGKMGGKNLDSCNCEVESSMDVNSALSDIF
jgi:hypothetical protein